MEFSIDIALIQGILRDESERMRTDIGASGPIGAVTQSGRRQDRRIAQASDVSTLACAPGCAWCCHFTVDVRPAEVFAIVDYVDAHLSATARQQVYADIETNSAQLRALTDDERVTQNLSCPFLADRQCQIYDVRPQSCRNYHATDASGCQRSYESPDDLEIDPDFAPAVYQTGAAHVEAMNVATARLGFDVSAYELNMAIAEARRDPTARQRYERGELPFTSLEGHEVPEEFDDLWEA